MSGTHGSRGRFDGSTLRRYGMAALCVVVAAAVEHALGREYRSGYPLFLFALAVMAAARFGGRGPGLLASSLSLLALAYFFPGKRSFLDSANVGEVMSLVVFAAAGAGISLLISEPRRPVDIGWDSPGKTFFLRRTVLFGSALLVLGVLAHLLYADFTREEEREQWASHSSRVLGAIHTLISNLQDAVIGQRSYLLTGDDRYHDLFQTALRKEQAAWQDLRQLYRDNPARQGTLDAVDRLVAAEFSELRKAIAIRSKQGLAASPAVALIRENTGLVDECRTALGAMESENRLLLAKQNAAADIQDMRMRWVLGFGSASMLILLVMAGVVIEQDSRIRERARLAVIQSGQRLRLALDAADAGTWEWDPQTGEIVWSEELWRVFGLPPQSCQPTYEAWRQLIHPDDRDRLEQTLREAVRTGSPLNAEFRVFDGEGRERWLQSRARPLRTGEGVTPRFVGTILNVTGRKRAEEEVREREAQFRTLANAIPQLCWMANADGWIFWYNQRWYEYTGTTPEQTEGWGWQSVHDPGTLVEVLERWKNSIVTGEPFDMVFPLRGADGMFRPFLTRIVPVCGRDGKVARWFGTNTDIYEQHAIEEALRESKELLKIFVQRVPASVAMLDREMRYLEVSDRWCADYSLTSGEMLGRSHYDIFPDLPERWKESHRRCLAGETVRMDEDCWERAGQDPIWLCWEIRPWGEREGKPEGLLIFSEDITARKRMESALREGEATVRTLLETAAQAILAVDAEGAVVLANRMAGEMFVYERQELIGMPVERLLPERLRESHILHRAAFGVNPLTRPMGIRLDLQGLRKDGTEFPIEVSLSTVETGRGVLAVAFVTDITTRKQAETSLQNSEKELRALAGSLLTAQEDERRRVARDLHDDVTQRLALLSIEIGKLAAEIPLSDDEIRMRLRSFQRQSFGISNEVRRLSHGLHPSVIEDCGLSTALEEFCEEFTRAHDINLKFDGPAADPGLSNHGASCLYRIAQECLRNVAKHSRATEVAVNLTTDGVSVRLVVKDNGTGFPVKADHTNGGLGIVSIKERIRMAKGTISITSHPGQGTEIVASVPLSGVPV